MVLPLLGLLASDIVTFGPGTSPEFQDTVRGISAAVEKGDKAKASRLLALLPAKTVTYSWDESAIPKASRADFATARDKAFMEWNGAAPGLRFKKAPQGALQFRFSPLLANRPEDANPLGVAIFFNEKAAPRMESIIGLSRSLKKVPLTVTELRGAVRYSLARYFGLSDQAQGGVRRPDLPGSPGILTNSDLRTVGGNFELIDKLRVAVQENKPVQTGAPQLSIDPATVDIGTVTQGDKIPFSVQLSNTGTAPLSYATQGDCGCVVGTPPGVIPPGGVVLLRPHVNSTEYSGK
ncbi:hypothetical protein EON81_22230, partial [bacterium]